MRSRVGAVAGAALAGLVLALIGGCTSPLGGPVAYHYFATPDRDDPWSRKIGRWQERERSHLGEDALRAPASVAQPGARAGSGDASERGLEAKYRAFRAAKKRLLAREVAEWIQSQAPDHYVPDGPIDRWATLAETLRQDGDDCDGLELLTFHLLRDLGFASDEIYRAIVFRPSDGQHHMVTLWFEDRSDPWVIDPTGAMTTGMPRMSDVPEWAPLKVFSVDEDFTVRTDDAIFTAQRQP